MKLITDSPTGLPNYDFVLMGIVSDTSKDYACILQLSSKQQYIEEIHWGIGKNINTATLHQVDDDKEWLALFNFVTSATTIFSPKKINHILEQPHLYFYSTQYTLSEDFQKRKKKEIL